MDQRQVERLYEDHAAGLFSFLAYRTGNRALAEDLLADSFERVIRARGRFARSRGSEKAWLYAIALNVLRDRARRDKVEERALAAVAVAPAAPAAEADAVADRDAVRRAIATLPDEERDAIALRFGAGLTVSEIAKVTGEPLARTEGRVYRALRKLREELEES